MMAGIQEVLAGMDSAQGLTEIAKALKNILPLVTEEDRMNFVINLIGGESSDKVASMVHL
jgi:hypothetical protein